MSRRTRTRAGGYQGEGDEWVRRTRTNGGKRTQGGRSRRVTNAFHRRHALWLTVREAPDSGTVHLETGFNRNLTT